ncbi:MAG: HDOD domain-containing protein [Deltaproteobacteria bacterium]|nr:HDOD domain-containing protein [Deltaproteobacteria bacterium]
MNARVLFVDDECNILEGLRHRLRTRRHQWDMIFVDNGPEALQILAQSPCTVIVSDMRMPGMDGAALLRRVQREFPAVSRIILTGYADESAMLRVLAVAHQCIAKPCDPGLLERVIERVCDLHALINDDALRHAVGKVTSLPSAPRIYGQLMSVLSDERASADDVSRLLQQDGSLCAKILHIVNSAYFRLVRPIVRVEEAVSYLGFNSIRQLALVAEVFGTAKDVSEWEGRYVAELQTHALLSAGIAAAMFSPAEKKATAFVAALLHDIGKLALATELPDRARRIAGAAQVGRVSAHVAEKVLYGVTHADIGAFLLGLWQIPFPIIEAVAHHHAPARVTSDEFDVPVAVHIADALAHEHQELSAEAVAPAPEMDSGLLDRLGVSTRLPEWRRMAGELARTQCEASP